MKAAEKHIPEIQHTKTGYKTKFLGFDFPKKTYIIMTKLGALVLPLVSGPPRYLSVTVVLHFSKKFALHLLLHYSFI